MKPLILKILFLICFNLNYCANASETLTSGDFNEIYKKVLELGQKHGNNHVLVVYDMDNTLLALNQDLGSDQWSDWQASLLLHSEGSSDLAVSDMKSLFALQQKLFALSGMHLTQAELPSIVTNLHAQGFSEFILTSRGTDMRDSSLRELKGHNLIFDWKAGQASETNFFLPYSLTSPEINCLTKDDIQYLKLNSPKPISFGNGLMLTSGQHKGALLKSFLCNTTQFSAIVFIDDKQKNIEAVEAAYKNTNIELVTYRYSKEDSVVRAFHSSDKGKVKSDWNLLKNSLDSIFLNKKFN